MFVNFIGAVRKTHSVRAGNVTIIERAPGHRSYSAAPIIPDTHRPICVTSVYICVARLKGNGRVRRARPMSASMWVVCVCVYICACVYLN